MNDDCSNGICIYGPHFCTCCFHLQKGGYAVCLHVCLFRKQDISKTTLKVLVELIVV